jgi:hypothetical protein
VLVAGSVFLMFFGAALHLMVFTLLFQDSATGPSSKPHPAVLSCRSNITEISSSIIACRSRGLSVEAL